MLTIIEILLWQFFHEGTKKNAANLVGFRGQFRVSFRAF